jgi:hypothetical protein
VCAVSMHGFWRGADTGGLSECHMLLSACIIHNHCVNTCQLLYPALCIAVQVADMCEKLL